MLDRLSDGENLLQICRDDHMPSESYVRKRALQDTEFGARYRFAREIGYARMADEILEIADAPVTNDDMQQRRLRIDTRKWLLSKVLPKIYGDRVQADPEIERTDKVEITFVSG